LAFQSNSICDATLAETSFEEKFKKMKNELQQNGVHIANLSANLRNTKTIGELSRNVKTFNSDQANYKMTQHIQQLPTTSSNARSSKPPFLIPMHQRNRGHQLKEVLKKALERSRQSTKNVVIMYDGRRLSSEEIKKALIECERKKTTFYFILISLKTNLQQD